MDEDTTMLIVEDEPMMRAALRELVKDELPQVRVREAANGAQAIEQCILHRPRVVLMDVRLPDANGIDLTAGIRRMFPETSVIIVSSLVERVYQERARTAGAAGYVAKEHIHRDLLPHLRRLLGAAPGSRQTQ